MVDIPHLVTIMCDDASMQTIRVSCRCGRRLEESIPKEIHDSTLLLKFECSCGRVHLIKEKHHISLSKEEYHDRFPRTKETPRWSINGNCQYDA